MLTTLLLPFLLHQTPPPEGLPKEAYSCVGRWDVTVDYGTRKGYAWLEIEPSGRILVGRYVGHGGSARPIAQVNWKNGDISFGLPKQWESKDLSFQLKLEGDKLVGVIDGLQQGKGTFSAVRTPSLKRDKEPEWGEPIELFNGRNLDGWKSLGRKPNSWTVKDGTLVNAGDGTNLVTNATFEDFKIHAEFRYPKGSNSGLYLRGRYEVQIEDQFGEEPNRHGPGAIYGFLIPNVNASKAPGEWQTYDVTLVGRTVTVEYNGVPVIVRQVIPGITGGALDCDEGKPGPIYIQGDHGEVEFRKVTIWPGR